MLILHATELKLTVEGELRVPTSMYIFNVNGCKYNINNTLKMAQVHFYEVAVREYKSYAPLLLHLHIMKMFYSYFRFGLVGKSCKRAVL